MAAPAQYPTINPITQATATSSTDTREETHPWTLPRLILVISPVVVFVAGGLLLGGDFATLIQPSIFLVILALGFPFAIVLAFKDRPWVYLTQAILVSFMPLVDSALLGWSVWTDPLKGVSATGAFLFLVTPLITLPMGIIAFIRTRKGVTFPSLRNSVRTRSFAYTVALSALFAGFALAGTLAANNAKDASGGYDFDVAAIGGQSIALEISDYQFQQRTPTVTAGKVTEITVSNKDGEFHTFTYQKDGVEYNHDILGGSSVAFLVLFEQAGTILFRCVPHSEGYSDDATDSNTGMTGVINVVS